MSVCVCVCVCVCVYIYIYIYRKRERERERETLKNKVIQREKFLNSNTDILLKHLPLRLYI